jgi:hypothetical protein
MCQITVCRKYHCFRLVIMVAITQLEGFCRDLVLTDEYSGWLTPLLAKWLLRCGHIMRKGWDMWKISL